MVRITLLALIVAGCADELPFDHPCDPRNPDMESDAQCNLVDDAEVLPSCPDGGIDGAICVVPPPEFPLGDREHRVQLSYSYALGRTEVTRATWEEVMGPVLDEDGDCLGDTCPAVGLNWELAATFCNELTSRRLDVEAVPCYAQVEDCTDCGWRSLPPDACSGYRMPTEAEWELVARRAWDDYHERLDDIANFTGTLDVVAARAPDPSGLHDMFGNAEEMMHDVAREGFGTSDSCLANPYGNARGGDGPATERMVRGGSAADDPATVGPTRRPFMDPRTPGPMRGLRLARTLEVLPLAVCR